MMANGEETKEIMRSANRDSLIGLGVEGEDAEMEWYYLKITFIFKRRFNLTLYLTWSQTK